MNAQLLPIFSERCTFYLPATFYEKVAYNQNQVYP